MGHASIEVVLAGTKGFAVALLAPLTTRIGNRPRVAADPGQILAVCSGPTALAVVEFTGEGSLPTIQALVRDGRGLRVVAGVPSAHAAAEGTLLAMGVEVGRWDGKIDGVVAAVDRAVAAMAAPPPPRAAPAPAAAPAAGPPSAPRRPSAPAAAAAPRVATPAAAPRAAQPIAASAPRPGAPSAAARPAAPAAAARSAGPAAPAASAAARPAPPASSAAAPRPSSPAIPAARPAAARPATAPAQAAAPTPASTAPAAPAAAQRAATMGEPPRPAPARAPAPRPPAPPPPEGAAPPPATPSPSAAAPAAPRPAANFFDDLESDDVPIDEEPPAPEVDFHAPGVYVAAPPVAAVHWPAGLCTDAEAEAALRAALAGATDSSLHALASKVLDAASELEREVLAGEPQAIDTAPIRRATVMRLRVAEALDGAPPVGSPVDGAALSGILGQIDGLLAEVAPLLQAAPEELAPALEAVRNSLVREAIDFSEAASRLGKAEAPAAPKPAPSGRPAAARVVSIDSAAEVETEKAERRRSWMAYAGLALVAVLAVGYHGWRYATRAEAKPQAGMVGAPPNSMSSSGSGGVYTVVSMTGKFDPATIQQFRAEQEQKGNRVEEVAPGVLRVSPATEPKN